jgi:hypothetical protein
VSNIISFVGSKDMVWDRMGRGVENFEKEF